ncbi:3-keto-5-aminohexanoate cleavage protein [Streptomyces sp. NPDC001553]|uniref:3-keto-5-aminohexanoate cleavage protein n=1 Tax=Streptomyces sp. NPDC001553 TaxID=3154385 RepID=UPI0033236615
MSGTEAAGRDPKGERGAGGAAARVPLQVALNGGREAAEGAAVPMSPEDLARAAVASVAAGAREVLVHPRSPCGRESLSPRVVGPLLEALRGAGVSVPLSVPAGIVAEPDPAARQARVRSWEVLPDRAVVRFTEAGAEELGLALLARGVAVDAVVPLGGTAGPEPLGRFLAWAVPDHGRVRLAVELPEADPALVAGLCWLPPVEVVLFGREAAAWPVLRLAARCGAGARIGVGDVLVLPDGRTARSNAELVTAALAEVEASRAARVVGATRATVGSR